MDKTKVDFGGDNIAQKKLIIEDLRSAYEPVIGVSDAPQGWECVAHLVMHWLKHPDTVPQPSALPLRGLVFIEDDGTIRAVTRQDI